MAEDLGFNLDGSIVPECIGDSIILIDYDIASVASFTAMLKKLGEYLYDTFFWKLSCI